MKHIFSFLLILISATSFSQNLGNPAVIGQSSRNQKVGKGFQIEDTLLAKGKVRFSVVSVGSTKDTFVTVVDTAGYISKVGKSTFLAEIAKDNLGVSYRTDSIRLYIIGSTDTIVFGYAVRGLAYASDTLSWYVGNTRTANYIGGGGGVASLSGLTAATTTNTINNVNNTQEWQWNSLTSGIGLKLSSNSTGAASNTQTLFSLSQSGANVNVNQTTYVQKISNSKTGSGSRNVGLRIDITNGSSTKNAGLIINSTGGTSPRSLIVENGGGAIELNGEYLYFQGSDKFIFGNGSNLAYSAGDRAHSFSTSNACYAYFASNISNANPFTINRPATRDYELMFGGASAGASTWLSFETSINTIRSLSGTLSFSANTGLGSGGVTYTPSYIMHVYGSNQNVGIGTATPVSSALLEINSTTKGTLITRMTGLQAEAISSPATMLLVAITNGNGSVITSTGFWYYDGTTWIKL